MSIEDKKFTLLFHLLKPKVSLSEHRLVLLFFFSDNCGLISSQNSEAENIVLIEMLDANEDGEVDSFEWTTMLSQVTV